MGVYIGGLEIPPKGKGVVVILCSSGAVYSGGQKVGTAVPIPAHGRLIDADALKAKQQEDADLFINAVSLAEKSRRDEALNAVANIVNAPTIIPAEE